MEYKFCNGDFYKREFLDFYSENMYISKKFLIENHLKLTYQKQLISNLDIKHKEWSRFAQGYIYKYV